MFECVQGPTSIKNKAINGAVPILLLLFTLSMSSCDPSESNEPSLFEEVSAAESGLSFENNLFPSDSLHILNFDYFYNGGGVAVIDINNDQLPDVFLGGNQVPGQLFLNKGGLVFEDITNIAKITTKGWLTGISVADVNADGFDDLYFCYSAWQNPERRANELWLNNGDLTFTEVAAQMGLADTSYSTQAAFFDYDLDNDLDIFLMNVDINMQNPHLVKPVATDGSGPATDRLYRNEGKSPDGLPRFTEVSEEAGIKVDGYGLGLAVNDFNSDGWPDVFVANDFIYNDILYINNQDGTFTDRAKKSFRHTSHFSMGTDAADINNDGHQDIVTLDMEPEDNFRQKMMSGVLTYDKLNDMLEVGFIPQYMRNNLHLNNQDGTFSEIGQLAGVYATEWSWSALLSDLDNDGFKDLFITNGIRKDVTDRDFAVNAIRAEMTLRREKSYSKERLNEVLLEILQGIPGYPQHNYLYKNLNGWQFENRSEAWGMARKTFSSGAVTADFDKDGDLDIIINNIDAPAQMYRNLSTQQQGKHYLKTQLVYKGENINGVGAKVKLWQNGQQQVQVQQPIRGFQSSQGKVLHFGLDSAATIDSLVVIWPNGERQSLLTRLPTDTLLQIAFQPQLATSQKERKTGSPLFMDVTASSTINYVQQENEYIDFKAEPLLPHQYSEQGPCLAKADIDGNGLEDLYIGGAANHSGALFFQQSDGDFRKEVVVTDTVYEDVAALFVDADSDGDADLYVVSGGSEFENGSPAYQDRLYLNDGLGNFRKAAQALPDMPTSGSCVKAADFDGDGDLDLFVGGRVVPRKYPVSPQSYLLRNDTEKGQLPRFTDVTASLAPALSEIGLVTDAAWSDLDSDGKPDLVVVGEWMPLTLCFQKAGNMFEIESIKDSEGWWNTLAAADFDKDGDTDFMIGNLGLNSRFKVSPQEPMEVHAKDFDQNGSFDAVMSYFIKGKKVTVAGRDKLADQMPLFRKNYKTYSDFAKLGFDDIFTDNILINTVYKKAVHFESSYLENLGDGTFRLTALPIQAQTAPIQAMVVEDFNQDGFADALMAGNSYATEVITGRYDAFNGLLLLGNGQNKFDPILQHTSGFKADKEAKSLEMLQRANGESWIIVGNNQAAVQSFLWQP